MYQNIDQQLKENSNELQEITISVIVGHISEDDPLRFIFQNMSYLDRDHTFFSILEEQKIIFQDL